MDYETYFIIETEEGSADCRAVFDVDYSTSPAEPYSWGGSRGMEIEVDSIELLHVHFGGAKLNRDTVVEIVGKFEVERQEGIVAEAFLKVVEAGDLAA